MTRKRRDEEKSKPDLSSFPWPHPAPNSKVGHILSMFLSLPDPSTISIIDIRTEIFH